MEVLETGIRKRNQQLKPIQDSYPLDNDLVFRILHPVHNVYHTVDLKISFIGAQEGPSGRPGGGMSIQGYDYTVDLPLTKEDIGELSDNLLNNETMQNEISQWMYEHLAAKIEDKLR
jgi:hypothetical protein